LSRFTFDASAISAPWTLTLPTGPGQAGQVLTTNGAGVTSWVEPDVGDQTPYYLASNEVFTVKENKQVLFARQIEVDGTLNVVGDLIQVNGAEQVDVFDAIMPFLIPSSSTYKVPANKQGLFAIPIEVDGTLVVDGVLVGV